MIILILTLISTELSTQTTYIVYLKAKQIHKDNLRLSQDALQRKSRYSIQIDDEDYSISANRLRALSEITPLSCQSKWLNAVSVKANEDQIKKIQNLDFVRKIEVLKSSYFPKSTMRKFETNYSVDEYGESYGQIKVHDGQLLHDKGYEGQGMKIAVFDAGFQNVPSISSFKHLIDENRLHSVKNIVENIDDVYRLDAHGTGVLGTMAGFFKDSFIGSAPKADYYLFLTEDPRSESRIEEFNWVIAAEMADSMGMDIINSSLGYHHFDDPSQNYSKSDMDGETTIISKGAAIAAEKGILVVNSAGNHGNNDWHIITAPADVEAVISVGATDINKNLADFSSRGYNAKNVIKPNIVSVGRHTTLYYDKGKYSHGSGTSFSSPLIAGLITCYWQSNKNLSTEQLKKIIYSNSSRYSDPSKKFGFGFPQFGKILAAEMPIKSGERISVYPNPSSRFTIVEVNTDTEVKNTDMNIYFGNKEVMRSKVDIKNGNTTIFIDTKGYAKGLYFLKIKMKNEFLESRFMIH